MDKDTVISVEHVSKKYCKNLKRGMIYGTIDIGRNMLGLSSKSDKLRKDEFWALNDVSFEVKRGETIGIIGPNGSGKTTLLKLLNGIFWPDKGKITIKGKVGALIELGAGFHPLLTGRENIYINAAILGMTKKEVDKKFDDIIEFADIGDFLDTPVKYYSSGMFVRLGFAIAINSEPDILLIDEVLAVGDVQFQAKCFRKIKQFETIGKTILIVSHDINIIRRHTNKVVLFNKGAIYDIGKPMNVVNKYLSLLCKGIKEKTMINDTYNQIDNGYKYELNNIKSFMDNEDICTKRKNYNKNEFRYGNGFARIIDFEILDLQGKEKTFIKSKDIILFRIKIKGYSFVKRPIFGIIIKTKEGIEVYGNNTLYSDIDVPSIFPGKELYVEYKIHLDLQPGEYLLSSGIAEIVSEEILPVDRRYDFVYINILPSNNNFELINLKTDIKIITQ